MPSEPPPPEPAGADPGAGMTAAVPEAAEFAAPRRLHITSILLGVDLKQLAQSVLVPLLASAAGPRSFTIVVLVAVGVIGLIARVLAWQRFTFSFDGEVMRVDEGVLSRNRRSLDVARIQQVEIDRGVLMRPLGLAALRIETAGSASEVEVDLRVVTEDEAERLRAAVRAGKARAAGEQAGADADAADAEPPARTVLTVPDRDVVLAAVTGARLLVLPAVLAGLLQFVGDPEQGALLDPMTVFRAAAGRWALLVAALIPLSVLFAIGAGLLRDHGFTITEHGDDLHVSRGLVATRSSVVPRRRVQLVTLHRNGLRRLLGVGTLRIHSGGGSGDADRRVAVPLLRDHEVDRLLGELLPGVEGPPALVRHPVGARRRAIWRHVRPALLPAAAIAAGWAIGLAEPLWWWWALAGAVVAGAVVLGVVEHRHLAHGLDARLVAARHGAVSVTTSWAPVVKVQAVSARANPFQRRLGLRSVRAHVAGPGGDVVALDAGVDDAEALVVALTRHAAAPLRTAPGEDAAAPAGERVERA